MEKYTKREKFEMLAALPEVASNPILAEFVAAEMENLTKRYANRKETDRQKENSSLLDLILEYMKPNEAYTVTDFIKAIPELNDLSNQRVAAIVRKGLDNKTIERVMDKRQAKFIKVGD